VKVAMGLPILTEMTLGIYDEDKRDDDARDSATCDLECVYCINRS
jgi:hypothetical protein